MKPEFIFYLAIIVYVVLNEWRYNVFHKEFIILAKGLRDIANTAIKFMDEFFGTSDTENEEEEE